MSRVPSHICLFVCLFHLLARLSLDLDLAILDDENIEPILDDDDFIDPIFLDACFENLRNSFSWWSCSSKSLLESEKACTYVVLGFFFTKSLFSILFNAWALPFLDLVSIWRSSRGSYFDLLCFYSATLKALVWTWDVLCTFTLDAGVFLSVTVLTDDGGECYRLSCLSFDRYLAWAC